MARRASGALPAFSRIVLETTGLAEPAPILHALVVDPELSSRLALSGVMTLVDAVNGLATLRSRPESARQIAVADRLVVAKSDLLPEVERAARLSELNAALRELNPSAPIVDGAAAEFGPAEFLAAPLSSPARSPARSPGEGDHATGRRRRPSFDGLWRGGGGKRSPHGVQSFAFRSDEPIDASAFAQFLSVVGSMLGPRLLLPEGPVRSSRPAANADPRRRGPARPSRPARAAGMAGRGPPTRGRRGAGRRQPVAAVTRAPRIDTPDLAALFDNPLAPRAGGLLGWIV